MGDEVEQIKERVSIADLVGEYVQLKPAGQNMKALCPFHSEKTPSFFVTPKRGTWHCFGSCSEGGDIFTFLQKAEGVDFPTALRLLAERAGVDLPTRGQDAQASSRRQRLLDLMQSTVSFYHEILMNQAAGKKAKEYMVERGVNEKTMQEFRIGYAPDRWDIVQQALARKGYTPEEIVAAGVAGRSERGSNYDRFRGRIIFPVEDSRGRVIALGGRIVPWLETGNEGKYINSPETALYEKHRTVYNLHRAKETLRKGTPCLVVEGYMDVVMLVQAGITNVVATSGTAFTSGHVAQLLRYTDTLHFAFDADAAGFSATVSATQAALQAGMNVATVVLPDGKDPADVAKKDAAEARTIMSATQPLMAVLLTQLKAASGSADKQKNLEALVPLIRLVKNPIQQGSMIEQTAAVLHIPEERVLELVQQAQAPDPLFAAITQSEEQPRALLLEYHVLGLILSSREVRQALFSYLDESAFLDAKAQQLYNSLQQLFHHTPSAMALATEALVDSLPQELQSLAAGLSAASEDRQAIANTGALQEGQTLVRTLRRRNLQEQLMRLQLEIAQHTDKERSAALERFRAVSQELAAIEHS